MMLNLPYPPSVNTYWRHPSKGKLAGRHLISEEGRRYRQDVWVKVMNDRRGGLVGPVAIEIELVAPDRRKRDLDNVLKALLDALTHAHVIEDDSKIWKLTVYWCAPLGKIHVNPPGSATVKVESL